MLLLKFVFLRTAEHDALLFAWKEGRRAAHERLAAAREKRSNIQVQIANQFDHMRAACINATLHTEKPHLVKLIQQDHLELFKWSHSTDQRIVPFIFSEQFASTLCSSTARWLCLWDDYQVRIAYQQICPLTCFPEILEIGATNRLRLLTFLPTYSVWYNEGISKDLVPLGNKQNSPFPQHVFKCDDKPTAEAAHFCAEMTKNGTSQSECFLQSNPSIFGYLRSWCARSCGLCKQTVLVPTALLIRLDEFLDTMVPKFEFGGSLVGSNPRSYLPLRNIPVHLMKRNGLDPFTDYRCLRGTKNNVSLLKSNERCFCFPRFSFCPVALSTIDCEIALEAKGVEYSPKNCSAQFETARHGTVNRFTFTYARADRALSTPVLATIESYRDRGLDALYEKHMQQR